MYRGARPAGFALTCAGAIKRPGEIQELAMNVYSICLFRDATPPALPSESSVAAVWLSLALCFTGQKARQNMEDSMQLAQAAYVRLNG